MQVSVTPLRWSVKMYPPFPNQLHQRETFLSNQLRVRSEMRSHSIYLVATDASSLSTSLSYSTRSARATVVLPSATTQDC